MALRKIMRSAALALLLPVLVSNCSTNSGTPAAGGGEAQVAATETTAVADEATVAAALAAPERGEYKISPYDSLQISVFQVQDLNRTVSVNADGSVTLPLLGKLAIAGRTTSEAELLIADRLRKSFLQSPQVSVAVAKFGQRVTVSGSVKSPKVITVDGQLTLTEAVANAGGLSDLANSNRVHIVRKTDRGLSDTIHDFAAIEAGRTVDPPIRGSDLIVAEESGIKVAFKQVKDVLPFAVLGTVF